jgi:hypothetical protein
MNEYKISVTGTVTRDLRVLAVNEDAAIKLTGWDQVWGDHEGQGCSTLYTSGGQG